MVDGIVQYLRQWEKLQCVPVHHPQTSPASRDERYPLLCSLTSHRHLKCLGTPICRAFMEIPSASSEGPVPARCPADALE